MLLEIVLKEPLIPTWLYKMVASMEAAIFNSQCDQTQNCQGGCDTIYASLQREAVCLPMTEKTI